MYFMYETINKIQESDHYYYIDYIPYNTSDPKFLELEDYFEKTYLNTFAKKIVTIILKMVYYYECEIFITEDFQKKPLKYEIPFDVNIRYESPDKIAYIIKQVIVDDFSSVQILFSTPAFLISISGGFSVAIYQPTEEVIRLLEQLVLQEGLFLKYSNC